jgi:hypothetical protein
VCSFWTHTGEECQHNAIQIAQELFLKGDSSFTNLNYSSGEKQLFKTPVLRNIFGKPVT